MGSSLCCFGREPGSPCHILGNQNIRFKAKILICSNGQAKRLLPSSLASCLGSLCIPSLEVNQSAWEMTGAWKIRFVAWIAAVDFLKSRNRISAGFNLGVLFCFAVYAGLPLVFLLCPSLPLSLTLAWMRQTCDIDSSSSKPT